jgi:hypothetical protein
MGGQSCAFSLSALSAGLATRSQHQVELIRIRARHSQSRSCSTTRTSNMIPCHLRTLWRSSFGSQSHRHPGPKTSSTRNIDDANEILTSVDRSCFWTHDNSRDFISIDRVYIREILFFFFSCNAFVNFQVNIVEINFVRFRLINIRPPHIFLYQKLQCHRTQTQFPTKENSTQEFLLLNLLQPQEYVSPKLCQPKISARHPLTHASHLINRIFTNIYQHAPGTKIGNDAVPEFHAETLPAGTAPSESTFEPNPTSDVPGQANNPDATERTNAQDTIVGATSQDVHTGLGLPIQGQSSQQLHGSGLTKGTKEGSGLTGLAGGALTN